MFVVPLRHRRAALLACSVYSASVAAGEDSNGQAAKEMGIEEEERLFRHNFEQGVASRVFGDKVRGKTIIEIRGIKLLYIGANSPFGWRLRSRQVFVTRIAS